MASFLEDQWSVMKGKAFFVVVVLVWLAIVAKPVIFSQVFSELVLLAAVLTRVFSFFNIVIVFVGNFFCYLSGGPARSDSTENSSGNSSDDRSDSRKNGGSERGTLKMKI